MAEDPYSVLGVARDATPDQIRRAYLKLAKKHHPDLNPGNKASEDKFKAASSANDLLSDPERRARFDRGEIDAAGQEKAPQQSYRNYAESGPGDRYAGAGANWDGADLDEIFGNMFNAGASSRMRQPQELYGLTVPFLDAVNGTTTRLSLPDGRTLDVKVPAGVEEGQMLRLRGQAAAAGAPASTIMIEIHIAEHPFFRRDGQTIRLELPVTVKEAVLGGRVTVPTPRGPVQMTVPANSETGREMRLRGRGVAAHGKLPEGDLYVTLRVMVGGADPALAEFLRNWEPAKPFDPRAGMMEAA